MCPFRVVLLELPFENRFDLYCGVLLELPFELDLIFQTIDVLLDLSFHLK